LESNSSASAVERKREKGWWSAGLPVCWEPRRSQVHGVKSGQKVAAVIFVVHAVRSTNLEAQFQQRVSKDSFIFYHLGLESKNSFVILKITYLAATELVMKFILNPWFSFHA
jgi:hypothetical protein